MVRAPANVPRSGTYELFEGIIETDRWFGPLITNMRLTKTDVPIDFRADFPLLQVQPLPRQAYEDTTLNNYELVPDLKQLTAGRLGRLLRHRGPPPCAGRAAARAICRRRPQTARRRGPAIKSDGMKN